MMLAHLRIADETGPVIPPPNVKTKGVGHWVIARPDSESAAFSSSLVPEKSIKTAVIFKIHPTLQPIPTPPL